jgi:hypothetical protein
MSLAIGGLVVLRMLSEICIFYLLALVMIGLCILFMFDAGEQWASETVSIMALLCVQMASKVANACYWSKIKTVFWLKK